jgi:hypothetical protein
MLALAAMAAAAFVVPASASAEEGNCVFDGLAGSINPGVMLVGGAGQYEFSGQGNCSLNGAPRATANIESHGNFTNTVCGTGTAFSRDPHLGGEGSLPDFTTIDDPATAAQDIENVSYHIDFRATQGTLEVHTVDDTDNNDTGTADDEADTLPANGHVAITPAEGESCNDGTGVNAFEVRGLFVAQW